MTLADIRSRLAGLEGRTYWRSLEELADTPEFREYVGREFPAQASEFGDPAGRRDFLKLMGASLALAGVSACTRQPEERIVPYVRQPEEIVPGRPLFYATAMPLGGFGYPLLAENHMGRPTKLEGNPDHPASLGATDLFGQASVLSLYDPDRSRTIQNRGEVKTWSDVPHRTPGGRHGPARDQGRVAPAAHRTGDVAVARRRRSRRCWRRCRRRGGTSGMRCTASARTARRRRSAIYRLDKADVVVALDADFLGFGPGGGAVHEGLFVAAPHGHAAGRAQPALRCRARADHHGQQRGSSSGAEGARRARVRGGPRRRGRRQHGRPAGRRRRALDGGAGVGRGDRGRPGGAQGARRS